MEPWQQGIEPVDVDARRGAFPRAVTDPGGPLPAKVEGTASPAAEPATGEVGDEGAHDPLTGLSSRASLIHILKDALARPVEVSPFGVALVDLDGFRATNQALGYAVGDRLLCAAARRLETCLRRGDTLVRFGSDEFAILLVDLHGADAPRIGERLEAVLSAPLDLGPTVLCPQASVGIAIRGPHHARPEDILRDAERALGRARAAGKGRYDIFDPRRDPRAVTLCQLEASLRRAIDSEDFRTHYEPMVSVKGGQVTGFEVVLWRKSGGGRPRR